MNIPTQSTDADISPQVIQIGFAGARSFYDASEFPAIEQDIFESELQFLLVQHLKEISQHTSFHEGHIFCGISQIAVGGDMVFARACAETGFLHRIFLPQTLDVYLSASGSDGAPDFSPSQQTQARELVESDSVVQEKVVSDSSDRHERFEDANIAIVAEADILVCLLRKNVTPREGGTADLMARARARGKPVVELHVSVDGNRPRLRRECALPQSFSPPKLPEEVRGYLKIAPEDRLDGENFAKALKNAASDRAKGKQGVFRKSALIIIGTHVAATLAALLALNLHGHGSVAYLLGAELVFLTTGFLVHDRLHRSHAVPAWAFARLVAEFARSVRSLKGLHVSLDYLFALPLPERLQPLLRTINVLHLRATRKSSSRKDWQKARTEYVRRRFDDDPAQTQKGQLSYYSGEVTEARRKLKWARWAFFVGSIGAFIATLLKFSVLKHWLEIDSVPHGPLEMVLGSLAILLPVIAVAALSLAAAFDLEARRHTYEEMREFLLEQRERLEASQSRREFECFLQDTELRLLGETATWYSRRAFVSVA